MLHLLISIADEWPGPGGIEERPFATMVSFTPDEMSQSTIYIYYGERSH